MVCLNTITWEELQQLDTNRIAENLKRCESRYEGLLIRAQELLQQRPDKLPMLYDYLSPVVTFKNGTDYETFMVANQKVFKLERILDKQVNSLFKKMKRLKKDKSLKIDKYLNVYHVRGIKGFITKLFFKLLGKNPGSDREVKEALQSSLQQIRGVDTPEQFRVYTKMEEALIRFLEEEITQLSTWQERMQAVGVVL
ncbi:MAG: hypothetical protein SNF33_03535 [Candidatus Algichlamydia australiensis]|nr:hypothetical protein [Chlamydiales bacterium]